MHGIKLFLSRYHIMESTAIIAIHGVGLPAKYSIIRRIKDKVSKEKKVFEDDIKIGEFTYPRIKFNSGTVSEIIEVNWADIQRTSRDYRGVAKHFVFLILSLLVLCTEELEQTKERMRIATYYRFCYEGILMWCLYPAIFLLFYYSFESWIAQSISILILIFFILIVTRYLSKHSIAFSMGYIWLIVSLMYLILSLIGVSTEEQLVQYATWMYVIGQALTVVMLLLAVCEIMLRSKTEHSRDYKLTRIAFLYMPFLAMSGVGACIWAISLFAGDTIAGNTDGYQVWSNSFLCSLNYNITKMEYAFGAAVAFIGLFILLGFGLYFISLTRINSRVLAGINAQNWISWVLHGAPAILILMAGYYLYSFWQQDANMCEVNRNTDILSVYALSASRVLPFLPLFIGPLALLFDVLGDILYYIIPPSKKYSTAQQTKSMLEAAIKDVSQRADDVVVLSHSQGTVIALDVIGSESNASINVRLITTGSPIVSLYKRFLQSSGATRVKKYRVPESWMNIFRLDDYVAGPVAEEGGVDVDTGSYYIGGHKGYWDDETVIYQITNKYKK